MLDKIPIRRQLRRMIYLFLNSLLFALLAFADFAAAKPLNDNLLARALSCQLKKIEVAGLMIELKRTKPELKVPVEALALPSANRYLLNAATTALEYTSRELYVAPGRIALVVADAKLEEVERKLGLKPVPYSPSSKLMHENVLLIAFKLQQKSLAGKVLVGCEYATPEAAGWID